MSDHLLDKNEFPVVVCPGRSDAASAEASVFGLMTTYRPGAKRVFDVVVAMLAGCILTPVLLAIALAVKFSSRGPLLFCQPRVGLNGTMFRCYKFRSMFYEAEDLMADRQTEAGDRRITPVGRWLRRYSLDELPQLFNVLRGDMSLVGPRPHAPLTKAGGKLFAEVVPGYHRRHAIRPGITGLAQVNGCRGPTEHTNQIVKRVQYDLDYIENASMLLDLRILWSTVSREIISDRAF